MNLASKRIGLTICLFSFLALIPMSCGIFCQDSCGCGPSAPAQNLIIKSMQLLTVDPSGQTINPLDTLPYNRVFKSLEIKDFEIKLISENFSPSTSFGLAYACSPLPVYSRDEIIGIKILNKTSVTLADGTTISPQQDISSYFGMTFFYNDQLITFQEFIGTGRLFFFGENFKIGFIQSPEKPLKLEFDVEVSFKSGKAFLLENQVLSIR